MSDKFQNKYRIASARLPYWDYGNQFGPQSKNLASVMRGFKSAVTKQARYQQTNFAWQSRYHDHIIRHETSFRIISRYIRNNPAQWQRDTFYPR